MSKSKILIDQLAKLDEKGLFILDVTCKLKLGMSFWAFVT